MSRAENSQKSGGGAEAHRYPQNPAGQCIRALIHPLIRLAELNLPSERGYFRTGAEERSRYKDLASIRETLKLGGLCSFRGRFRQRDDRSIVRRNPVPGLVPYSL